jgi:hypothetical protein
MSHPAETTNPGKNTLRCARIELAEGVVMTRPLLVACCLSLLTACGAPTDSWSEATPETADTATAEDTTPATVVALDSGTVPATDSATSEDSARTETTVDAPASGCDLPPRDCSGTATYCGELVPFEPVKGIGYDNYPLNGETTTNQYRSFCRRDLMMLVKYAAAFVDCKAKTWTPGNGAPLALGDMSEKDGSIPGTSIGSPGHPAGTHLNGYDMDIGYYQTEGTNNYLRPVCPHTTSGSDAYHCTGEPTILDLKRTALYLGAFLTSDRTRVIGVDGRIGPLVLPAIQKLCDDGTLPKVSCDRKGLIAYEPTDTGKGWYKFHHHHFHVSLKKVSADWSPGSSEMDFASSSMTLSRDIDALTSAHVLGHTHVE